MTEAAAQRSVAASQKKKVYKKIVALPIALRLFIVKRAQKAFDNVLKLYFCTVADAAAIQ